MGVGEVGLRLCLVFAECYNVIDYDPCRSRLDSIAAAINKRITLTWTDDPVLLSSATYTS